MCPGISSGHNSSALMGSIKKTRAWGGYCKTERGCCNWWSLTKIKAVTDDGTIRASQISGGTHANDKLAQDCYVANSSEVKYLNWIGKRTIFMLSIATSGISYGIHRVKVDNGFHFSFVYPLAGASNMGYLMILWLCFPQNDRPRLVDCLERTAHAPLSLRGYETSSASVGG